MGIKGTKVESNIIQVYYTARNILIEIINKFIIIYQIFNIKNTPNLKKIKYSFYTNILTTCHT